MEEEKKKTRLDLKKTLEERWKMMRWCMDVLKDDEEGWITGRYEEDFEEENATITKPDNQMVFGQPEQYLKGGEGKDDIKDNTLPHKIKTKLIEEAQKTTSDSQTSDRKMHEGRSSLLGVTEDRCSSEKRRQKSIL